MLYLTASRRVGAVVVHRGEAASVWLNAAQRSRVWLAFQATRGVTVADTRIKEDAVLILTRKPGESVWIRIAGVDVRVQAVEVKGKQVRLGIEAPPEAQIHRLFERLDTPAPKAPREARG